MGAAGGDQGAPARSEGLRLGSLFGVPVLVAPSYLLIALVITFLFAPTVRQVEPTIGAVAYLVAFGYALLLGLSVLVHELAHALTARGFGIPASRIVLTLWGGHTQFEQDVVSPGRSFAIAVAGPLSNAVLAGVGLWLYTSVDAPPLVRLMTLALTYTNGFVAVTNALPGLPLDGGRLLEAAVWKVSRDRDLGTVVAGWVGRVVAVVFALAVIGWPLLQGGRPTLFTVAWACALGALLWSGAGAALQSGRIRRRAPGATVEGLARPAVAVPAGSTLADALDTSRTVPGGSWVVLLDHAGAPVAVLDPAAVAEVPVERRGEVLASSAARALPAGAVVAPTLEGQGMLRVLSDSPSSEWVVRDASGAVTGLLLAKDVVAAVMGPRAAARS